MNGEGREVDEMERCTGKTFRKILEGLLKASEGRYVVFVSGTRPHLDAARRKAEVVVSNLIQWDGVNRAEGRITFPNGGVLRFMLWDTYRQLDTLCGIENLYSVFDEV